MQDNIDLVPEEPLQEDDPSTIIIPAFSSFPKGSYSSRKVQIPDDEKPLLNDLTPDMLENLETAQL